MSPIKVITLEPKAVMNDYTKNISESVWSPGLYLNNNKLETIKSKYQYKSGGIKSKFEHS